MILSVHCRGAKLSLVMSIHCLHATLIEYITALNLWPLSAGPSLT